MPDLNPIDAVIHGIVEALRAVTELAGVTMHKGWPADVDFALPAIAVTAQRGETTKGDGRIYRTDDVDATNVDVFFQRGEVEQPLQLDLWTKDKTQRKDLEPHLRKAFYPTVADNGIEEPPPPGMMVQIPHHDVTVRVEVVDELREDAGSARDGYARVVYALETDIPLLTKVRYTKADFTASDIQVGPDVAI